MQGQALRAFAQGGEVVPTAAFRVFLHAHAQPFYRSRAIPVAEPGSWEEALRELRAVFEVHDRTPRLEFFAELWPSLEPELQRTGGICEMRSPAMALDRPPAPASCVEGTRLLCTNEPEPVLAAFMAGAGRVFAGLDLGDEAAERAELRAGLAERRVLAAIHERGDRIVSGASLIGVGDVAELAGVWTLPGLRRRGHAQAVCTILLSSFFAGGGELCWLAAESDQGCRLYDRLGFARVGTQLNYALPR